MGVTRNKVHRDIQRLRRDWQELSVASYEKKAAYVLENYSYVAKQAKVAFEASIGKVEKRKARKLVTGDEEGKTEVTVETEESVGDPRFLELFRKATDSINRVIGAEKPQKHSYTDSEGNDIPFAIIRFEERLTRPREDADGGIGTPEGE